jgi:uncharacterized membrane protein
MTHPQGLSNRIDAYLLQLRECLGELPPEEVTEILKEIRGHILERAEASGELTEERLVAILKSLGRPEDIAPLYQADAAVARARISLSPRVVMRGIQRWSRVSGWGFVLFVAGVVGYAGGFALILSGICKIFAPAQIGAWVGPHAVFNIGVNNDPAARDVLGWWLVPISLVGGAALVLATTRVLRWTLRFARLRKPTAV